MRDQLNLMEVPRIPRKRPLEFNPKEFKVVALRECPMDTAFCDTPDKAAAYWRESVADHPYFDPASECFVTIMLNTRRRIIGHNLVSIGTIDTLLVTPAKVFRAPIVANAAAIVLTHNHPSGDPSPSEADIKVTRDLVRAGTLLKIEVLDHVVLGRPSRERPKDWASLRELGYLS